jgi:N-acyl-D-aspartate/D-glutamate deacylase
MPVEALQAGVPWDWSSTEDFLGRLEHRLVPNAGFMVGHSALRRKVLHEEATERGATEGEIAEMAALLRAGLSAGGIGFSSTWSMTHNDHFGKPVPSRLASKDELVALSEVLSDFPGTSLEFIPGPAPFSQVRVEVMAAMSRAAGRPLNWNVLVVHPANLDMIDAQLRASDTAQRLGGEVYALSLPDAIRIRLTFLSGFVLETLPGWGGLFTLPAGERRATLADPRRRKELADLAETSTMPTHRHYVNWADHRLETFAPELEKVNGRRVGDIARERNVSAFDALIDTVLADDLRTGIITTPRGEDDASWKRRVELWRDPRVIVGASDAGAHLDMSDTFSYATTLLAEAVRRRGLLPLEEAVMFLTSRPARFYGLVDRGRIAPGAYADLVVFDPERIGPGEVTMRYDLPGGAGRLYGEARGVEHVFVNGEEVVRAGSFTDARPGTLLRSGRDTTEPAGGRA